MKIKCTVCNKEFYYGDHNSPMFIDEVWNKIINYFKLDWDILVLRYKKKQGAVKTLFTKF